MKRRETVELYKKITGISKKEYSKHLLLAIMKTKNSIKDVVDEIVDRETKLVNDDSFRILETNRVQILEKYSNKDENGVPVIKNNSYDIPEESISIATEEMAEMRKQNQKLIDEYNKKTYEYTEYVESDVDVQIYKTKIENLPEKLEPAEFEFLMNFVEEE